MSSVVTRDDLRLSKVSDALGATVEGLDLASPLSADTLAQVLDAFARFHLLVFKDQTLDADAQVAFSLQFGELEVFPEQDKTKETPKVYHVANVSTNGELLGSEHTQSIYQKVNARWHTDSSYRYIPSLASIMYGIEVLPPDAPGGETEFSNMFAAYAALPDDMKERIEPLHMVHYYEFGRRLFAALPPVTKFEREAVPPVAHPLVRVHPDRNNKRSLYMTTNAGNEVSGMSLEDGQALHLELAEFVSQPQFRYAHRWDKNDLVMWDNRCLLHRAAYYDMDKYRRVFRRTTVAGSGPIIGPYTRR